MKPLPILLTVSLFWRFVGFRDWSLFKYAINNAKRQRLLGYQKLSKQDRERTFKTDQSCSSLALVPFLDGRILY
jgi:hypothetical protein